MTVAEGSVGSVGFGSLPHEVQTASIPSGLLIVRLGDSSDHNGEVITAANKSYAEGALIARVGDLHSCPIPGHGITEITTGALHSYVEGAQIARQTDQAACGARLISGAVKTYVGDGGSAISAGQPSVGAFGSAPFGSQ